MKKPFLVGLLITLLPGCVAMQPYDEVDYGKTVDGKMYMRDTPRTWAYLTKETDDGIAMELKGKPPMGGLKSWNEGWVRGIRHLRSSGEVEHPEKYIAYIVEQRRKAGLAEIVFPEPEKTSPPTEPPPKKSARGDANSLFGR